MFMRLQLFCLVLLRYVGLHFNILSAISQVWIIGKTCVGRPSVFFHSFFCVFRDNVGDFIAANRFSDLLVNVNLDETQSTSVSKTSLRGVTAHLVSGSVPHQITGM